MISFLYDDPMFMRRCLALTKDSQDAEDLLQDIALKLLSKEDILQKPIGEVKAYTYTMIRNRFFDNTRKAKTHQLHFDDKEAVTLPTVERDMQIAVDVKELVKKLDQLDPAHKKQLLMIAKGMNYKELSAKTGKPLNTLLADVREARRFINGKRDVARQPKKCRSKTKKKQPEWTKCEDEILRTYCYLDAKRISELYLDRTEVAIFVRCGKLKISLQECLWEESEDIILKAHFHTHTAKQLKELLPKRTVKAINHRTRALGLKKLEQKPWTTEEKEELKRIYRVTKTKDLEKKFGRKFKAIQIAYRRLNKNNHIFAFLKRKKI